MVTLCVSYRIENTIGEMHRRDVREATATIDGEASQNATYHKMTLQGLRESVEAGMIDAAVNQTITTTNAGETALSVSRSTKRKYTRRNKKGSRRRKK